MKGINNVHYDSEFIEVDRASEYNHACIFINPEKTMDIITDGGKFIVQLTMNDEQLRQLIKMAKDALTKGE